MALKCVVANQDPQARKRLKEYIQNTDFLALIGQAENPSEVIKFFNDKNIDIIFLDLCMPGLNGIEFLKALLIKPITIVTSIDADYAAVAYELNVVDYLIMPIRYERFMTACNKAKDLCDLKKIKTESRTIGFDHFFIKCNDKIEKVIYEDLLFAEAMTNYVILHTISEKLIVYITIKSLEEQLPSTLFIKVHRSFIVNMNKIKSISGSSLNVGTKEIAISQGLREAVLKNILKGKLIKRQVYEPE